MKIRQLKYFVSAVGLGSLSAVAKEQGVTVQAVSKSIVQLERELGRPLLVRDHDGVAATVFGSSIYDCAALVVERSDEVDAYLESLRVVCGSKPGHVPCESVTLGVGMAASRGGEWACARIASLLSLRFRVSASLSLTSDSDGLAKLRGGEFDGVILVGRCEDEDLELLRLGVMSLRVVMRKGHPLERLEAPTAHDVARFPVLVSSEFTPYVDAVSYAFSRFGECPQMLDRSEGHSVEADVIGGDAVFLSANAPLYALMHPQLPSRCFSDATPVTVPIELATLRGSTTPAVELMRYVAEQGVIKALFSGSHR